MGYGNTMQNHSLYQSFVRTDMASELFAAANGKKESPLHPTGNPLHDSGFLYSEMNLHGLRCERLTVASEEASAVIGKSIGTYFTLHTGPHHLHTPTLRRNAANALLTIMAEAARILCADFRVPAGEGPCVHIPQTTLASPGEEAILRRPISPEWDQDGHLYNAPFAVIKASSADGQRVAAEGEPFLSTEDAIRGSAVTDLPPAPISDDAETTGVNDTAPINGPFRSKTLLAVGLGNPSLTPDALGPMCVGSLNVTRHLSDTVLPGQTRPLSESAHRLCAITPLVIGQTGIETLELVRGAVRTASPDLVILIDALAASELGTLSSTVQISTTGIHPGGGIGNRRMPLDKQTLGVPVMTVGVPTMIAASTLICRALEDAGILPTEAPSDRAVHTALHRVLTDADAGYVSPKDADLSVAAFAQLIAHTINTLATGEDFAEACASHIAP